MSADDCYTCPFCGQACVASCGVTKTYHLDYYCEISPYNNNYDLETAIKVKISKCPKCSKISYEMSNDLGRNHFRFRYPQINFFEVPDYVPQAIRDDYYEACAIVDLSPKASATLSRRCLQGMIQDFWGIKGGTLNSQIAELHKQQKIEPAQIEAIDILRRAGNVGAHMERDVNIIVDIDLGEAEKLINLLRLLVKEWYVARHDREELYAGLRDIAKNIEDAKNSIG